MLTNSSVILRPLAVLASTMILAAGSGRAQSITGTVYDQTGNVVSNARVMLMQDYMKLQETKSGAAGEFSFAGLRPGMYQVQIKQPAFSLCQQTVILKGDEQARVYAVLPLARALDSMQINARLAPGGQKQPGAARKTVRAGGKVELPKALVLRPPAYPAGADARGVDGAVVLYAAVNRDGSVSDVVVLESPDPELENEAVQTMKKWRYQPMKLNGHPVETHVTIVFNFRLE